VFEIGNSLREARERQGRTFADLERTTQIRTRYLKALEEEQFSLLPASSYTRGFLRVYADELGLDGRLYVDEFNSRFSVSEPVRTSARRQERRVPVQQPRRIAVGAVIAALAIIAGGSVLFVFAFTSKPAKEQVANLTTPNGKTTTLQITAFRGDAFVDARAGDQGGKTLWSGTLIKGHHTPLMHAPTIWVRVSAAQNVRWAIAGGASVLSGDRMGPKTVLFSPGGHKFLSG
jgi:hypothetical protein